MVVCVFRSQPFPSGFLLPQTVMDRLSSSASTVPSIDDYFEHNMWNPLLELLFLQQANGIFASYLVEIDLAKIALSCHFAPDLLCYKEEVLASARRCIGHHCPWSSLCFRGTISTLAWSCLARRYNSLFHVPVPSLAGAFFSRVCIHLWL